MQFDIGYESRKENLQFIRKMNRSDKGSGDLWLESFFNGFMNASSMYVEGQTDIYQGHNSGWVAKLWVEVFYTQLFLLGWIR